MRTLSKIPTISTQPILPPESKSVESKIVIGPHTLYHGDCLQVLKSLPDCSVDSVVTDPPAGIGFMGKEWDDFRRSRNENDTARPNQFGRLSARGPQYARRDRDNFIDFLREVMQEVYRVLKPGGHALVWAIPRTSHWTATACEDAGFEIRDTIYHIFGTGFPKSMDISKAIDKSAGATRQVIGSKTVTRLLPNDVPFGEGLISGQHNKPVVGGEIPVTAPATLEAAQWEGWGTALKPSVEEWKLCRKPIEGTVAANVLKYGTGGLNIDGCRVEFQGETDKALAKPAGKLTSHGKGHLAGPKDAQDVERSGFEGEQNAKGRFPAHLIHDGSEEVLAGFPNSKDGVAVQRNGGGQKIGGDGIYQGSKGLTRPDTGYGGEGSAARFFYCTKASKKDRNEGVDGKNGHPTVKNTELMQYLCRLITPPGGLVLDPFAGSFSTGKAAIKEGFRFIGIEAEREYFDVGVQRIRHEAEKDS